MIRRRKVRPADPPAATDGAVGEAAIPTPVQVAGAEAAGGEQRPPPQVLDELMAAFAADQAGGLPRRRVDSTDTDAPDDGAAPAATETRANPADAHVEPSDPAGPTPAPTMSTRAMSAEELDARANAALQSPAPPSLPPEGAEGLVPEATKRSTRRSRREMRKEAKRAARREAQHAKKTAKQQRTADKAARKAAKKAARDGTPPPPVDTGGSDDVGEGVRIIPPGGGPGITPPSPVDPGLVPPSAAATAGRTVAVITDDDLPDPVYLEGELDGSASDSSSTRSRVFIDDRDPATGSMVSLEAATTAARMEPRLRERRAAVRRAASRKRLKWVLVVTGVVGIVVAVLAVLGSELFAIDDVEVQGAVYSRGPALDAVVADIDGANVLRLDTEAAERALDAIPWVEDARVTTQFPHGARIEIRERQPTVTYQGADSAYRVLDEHGRVLDVVAGGRPSAYLEVMVTDGPDLAAGEMAPAGYRAAAMLVQSLPAPLRAEVANVSVDTAGTDLGLALANGVEVRFGAAQDLVDKIVRLQVALTNPDPEEAAPTQLIDVSTEDVILR